ncbi:MAG: UDP-glucose/GDP-mannose dehydrogenase family protein [Candidatus Omnitrophota bacterium]|nr:UDP-glucose/GDP-mannose dehydrogenase family protein [Candidatus Omnitrophota bacterium]
MNIAIIGAGYVGLVTGACFSELGNSVICVDNDPEKISLLKQLKMPFYEKGLDKMVKKNVRAGRLVFTDDIKEAVKKALVIFICVGTPPREGGEADLSYIEDVATQIAKNMSSYRLIIEKSTVPVETGSWIERTIKINNKKGIKFDVASNPEFLKEGTAIEDFMHPDRIVIGVESKKAKDILTRLYSPIKAEIVVTDIKSAELIKHASNSFLAAKISFINSIANICEKTGADIEKVGYGMGLDKRIGKAFLKSGIGYGGFCFPKDLDAFIHISEKMGYDFSILKAVRSVNENQKHVFLKKIEKELWIIKDKTIGVLGLAFKPNTDDMRFAPSIDIINSLIGSGARIKAYDPQALEKARIVLKGVDFCKDPYDTAKGSDALLILTEWDEFKAMELSRIKKLLKNPLIIDGRNMFDPVKMKKLGFKYVSMGRSSSI